VGRVDHWLKHIRAPFLSLSLVLVILGCAAAWYQGAFSMVRALLTLAGLVSLHISVNVLNEHSDFQTGIDFQTSPTPFSGGSGMLVAGHIGPSAAYAAGLVSLAAGALIGAYLVWQTSLQLLPLLLVGAFAVLAYTDFLVKHAAGEVFAGLGLGFLPVLGASFVQLEYYSAVSVVAAVPAGLLTFNLLLLNEFPDLEADRTGGRRNLLILLGEPLAGKLYGALMICMYGWIIAAVSVRLLPVTCLAALMTLAMAWKPIRWAWGSRSNSEVNAALGSNVITNLGTQALLGAGFIVGRLAGL
jgi:1,4-dihydroxy-2-naphthoate octaprenyltransferase